MKKSFVLLFTLILGINIYSQKIVIDVIPSFHNPSRFLLNCNNEACKASFLIFYNDDSIKSSRYILGKELEDINLVRLLDSFLMADVNRPLVLDGVRISIKYCSKESSEYLDLLFDKNFPTDKKFYDELVKLAASTCDSKACKVYIRRLREYNRVSIVSIRPTTPPPIPGNFCMREESAFLAAGCWYH